jgi:hypothetical protein
MPHLSQEARSILGEGRQAYVAVTSADGPHVTPELYAVAGDDLWFAVAATTLKARVLPDHPRAGALVRAGGRAVVLTGTATTYDVRSPGDIRRAVTDPNVARALTSFVTRNAADLAGFARDAVTLRLGRRLPPRRLLVRLRPDRVTVMPGEGDAVLGWEAADGPLALPLRWDGATGQLPPDAARDLLATAPACVVTDEYNEPGPAAKTGHLRRGTGHLAADGTVTLDVAKVTTWDGVETATRAGG